MNDKERMVEEFRALRQRSAELFAIVDESSFLERPIPLRNPILFYEGHLPAFNVNTLARAALARPGIDEHFEKLFERGIDPDDLEGVNQSIVWPSRSDVLAYGRKADLLIEQLLSSEKLDVEDHPYLHNGEAVQTVLEHEAMHQETLLYMLHQLPLEKKKSVPQAAAPPPRQVAFDSVEIPAGQATLGTAADRFGWDNEFGAHQLDVPRFSIDRQSVTNGQWLEFLDAGGYRDESLWSAEGWRWRSRANLESPSFWERVDGEWFWRGMFELIPLPLDWPIYVTLHEALAFARWKGSRVPTEPEYHRAAFGTPEGEERIYPWGDVKPTPRHGNFGLQRFDPLPAGSFPAGASAWGVDDLVGNGWEWTSSEFVPFPGFRPMNSYPQYSADFFDGRHFVLKGASPVTPERLIRRGFRNWFRPNYPYVYAKFRLVRS
jgi:gamma-glutamyl hercynylcysteine S-oxide synthase